MGAAENTNQPYQFLVNAEGKKSHVVVPLELLEDFIEDIQDSRDIQKLKDEPTISFDEFVEEMKKDGKL